MTDEIKEALSIVEKACSSLVANLNDHQIVQNALAIIKKELGVLPPEFKEKK